MHNNGVLGKNTLKNMLVLKNMFNIINDYNYLNEIMTK